MSVSYEEAIATLTAMFPRVDSAVVEAILELNGASGGVRGARAVQGRGRLPPLPAPPARTDDYARTSHLALSPTAAPLTTLPSPFLPTQVVPWSPRSSSCSRSTRTAWAGASTRSVFRGPPLPRSRPTSAPTTVSATRSHSPSPPTFISSRAARPNRPQHQPEVGSPDRSTHQPHSHIRPSFPPSPFTSPLAGPNAGRRAEEASSAAAAAAASPARAPSPSPAPSPAPASSSRGSGGGSNKRWRNPLPQDFLTLPPEVFALAGAYGGAEAGAAGAAQTDEEVAQMLQSVSTEAGEWGIPSASPSRPLPSPFPSADEMFLEQIRGDPELAAYLASNPAVARDLGIPHEALAALTSRPHRPGHRQGGGAPPHHHHPAPSSAPAGPPRTVPRAASSGSSYAGISGGAQAAPSGGSGGGFQFGKAMSEMTGGEGGEKWGCWGGGGEGEEKVRRAHHVSPAPHSPSLPSLSDMRRRFDTISARFRRNAGGAPTGPTSSSSSGSSGRGVLGGMFDGRGQYASLAQHTGDDDRDALIGESAIPGARPSSGGGARGDRVKNMSNRSTPHLGGGAGPGSHMVEIELGHAAGSAAATPPQKGRAGSGGGSAGAGAGAGAGGGSGGKGGAGAGAATSQGITFSIDDDDDDDGDITSGGRDSETRTLTGSGKKTMHV
jgi:hypothetical protein